MGIATIGLIEKNNQMAALGLLASLGGHLFTDWLATRSIGAAGENLEKAGTLILQNK